MSKQKSQILILAVVIILGFLYAYIQYFFIPEWGILKGKNTEVSERREYLTKLEESYRILPDLQEEVKALETQASTLEKKVPMKLDKPDIMLTIYNLAKDNGISPKSLSYEPVTDEGNYLTMGMTFSCTGPVENIYTLVEKFLNGNKYIFALDSINFSKEEDGTSTVDMRIVAYVYK